jgi:hypothetical protein
MVASQPYTMPATGDDPAGNLALFLTVNTGSCCGHWFGTMRAADQRRLFGRFLGKGRLTIAGDTEQLLMFVKVAFGQDFDCRENIAWRDLPMLG